MNDDKAIRAAKLTLGGILEKNRAKQAKERAPGQIAPSKYMPNVPRAVHAAGGYVPAPMMQNTPRLAVARAPVQAQQPEADFLTSMQSLTDTVKSFSGDKGVPAPDTAPEPHAARAEPHGYGEGISAEAAKAMSGLQGAWTGQDFGIVSGYRDPKKNEEVGGAKGSQHIHGNAFDVDTTGWSPEDKLALADAAWEQGFRGFGFYDNNMHFDVGAERGWGPSFSRDSIPEWAQGWTANRYGYADGGRIGDRATNLAAWHADADDAVKNPDGTPKVFYHRTSGDFSTFKADKDGPSGPAMFFGDDPSNLPQMHNRKKVGDNIMPVHLHMKSPLFLDEFNLREMRERHAGGSKDFPHLITPQVADSLQAKGFDGIVAENIYGKAEDANEYVTFQPHQIKSAIGNQGAFDPGNPDITKAEGGEISGDDVAPVADLGQARQQKQIRQFHTGLMGDIKASTNNLMEAHQKALDAGVFDGYEVGDVLQGSAHPMRITGRFVRKWKPSSMTLQSFDRMGAKPTIIEHEDTQYIPMLRYETGLEGTEGWQSGDVYLDGVKAAGYKKMGGLRAVRAFGGRIITDHGLYSKAAEIIRSLPQEKGTVDQYIAAAKARGVKPAEIEHAGRPEGDKISREDMAKHFDRNLPQMEVHQYGENPSYLSKEQEKRIYALWGKPKTEAEEAEYDLLTRRTKGPNVKYESSNYDEDNEPSPTQYHDYTIPGGSSYRERLLTLPKEYGADGYQSSHWDDANVLAHVRMSDRTIGGDRESMRPVGEKLAQRFGVSLRDLSSGSAITGVKEGLITPEEGATFSRFMRWNNGLQDKPGLDKRVLHVEEMQSDWGQEGRERGFKSKTPNVEGWTANVGEGDPASGPIWEVRNADGRWILGVPTGTAGSADEAIRHAVANAPADRFADASKLPTAPYVQNTQHWTDLALKNVLHEAAMGNYDHVVFSPGQAQADRYGLETKVDSIAYHPGEKTFTAFKNNRPTVTKNDIDPNGVKNLIGKDLAEKLLHPDNAVDLGGGEMFHSLSGDDLKMGGEGMRGYYDNILPKSVMRLAQQHDPDIKPGSMPLSDQYTGFSIPMTDKLKQGILGGQPAFKRGGTVDVDKALAITRGFTKDGKAATMRLKLKE